MSAKQRATVFETILLPINTREAKRAAIRAMKKAAKQGKDDVRQVLERMGIK